MAEAAQLVMSLHCAPDPTPEPRALAHSIPLLPALSPRGPQLIPVFAWVAFYFLVGRTSFRISLGMNSSAIPLLIKHVLHVLGSLEERRKEGQHLTSSPHPDSVPGPVLCAWPTSSRVSLQTTLGGGHRHPHFTHRVLGLGEVR